jgi:hypothetical protein
MKRERILQVFAGILGFGYLSLLYPLYTDLWHSRWLLEMNNACDPMFLSWFVSLGPFLLLAARKPSSHRSLIVFAACQCLVHAAIMAVQTAQAWKHGVHRQVTDVIFVGIIGSVLLVLSLPGREQPPVITQRLA